jgi:uncharacterized protein YbcI
MAITVVPSNTPTADMVETSPFSGMAQAGATMLVFGPKESGMRTKGQLEADISEAIVKFEREYMGRGPEEVRTYLLDDIIMVRLQGVLTPAERQLARSDHEGHGRALIKQVRMELLEKARPLLDTIVRDITGQPIKSLHTDISTLTGERIVIFSLGGTVSLSPTNA